MNNREEKRKKFFENISKDETWVSNARQRREKRAASKYSFSLSQVIRGVLKEEGITIGVLAERLGCTVQNASKMLSGKENLTFETVEKIERVLSIKLLDIRTGGFKQFYDIVDEKETDYCDMQEVFTMVITVETEKA